MNYKETLDYMYSQLPMFHRIGKAAYKANLDNAMALDEICGHPHRNYRTIHIAGTNGKGSVSHMLASVLHEAGYKTGLFTSPHLLDFRERIRVNGEMIPEEAVTDFIQQYKNQFEALKPSFFEMTSAMAYHYFNQEKVDVAVIETGLGGRLDSTNIITPELSVITNISYDHTELLGDTLEKIATEKAGIIKSGVPVVVGETHPETRPVFESVAAQYSSPLMFADAIFSAVSLGSSETSFQEIMIKTAGSLNGIVYELDLHGLYQQKNICTLLAAVSALINKGFHIVQKDISNGLKYASVNTGLQGRWQVLSHNPRIICDTGHNRDGISWVVDQIRQLKYGKLHFIFGMVADKDISHVLPLLPGEAVYYFTKASIPRALDEKKLQKMARSEGLKGKTFPSVDLALAEAKKKARPNDLIFIGGSTFVVADALQHLRNF